MKKSFLTPIKRILSANEEVRIDAAGSTFLVWSADANVTIAWDDNASPGTYGIGQGYELEGGEQFKVLNVKNTSGAPNTVIIFAGNGTLLDFQKEISISLASMTALAAAINTPVALKLKVATVAAGAAAQVYSGYKSLEIIASGTGTVRIQTASGTDFQLPGGVGKSWSCETDKNYIEDVTVTPDVNTGFDVEGLYL